MHYRVTGRDDAEAETIVLSAGLGGSAGFWAPQMAAFEERYRVLAYDHAGTGANAGSLPANDSIARMAADVVGLLDTCGIDRAHVIGHALGGLVGLQLGLDAPERLASLILVNAWARLDSQTLRCFEARLALLRHVGPEAYVRAQPIFLYPAPWLSANADRIARDDAHGIAHFQGVDNLERRIAALRAFDVAERLGAIATPTLVAASRDDILVPCTASEQLAAGLPNARLLVVPYGGHGFSVVDPAVFNDMALSFLGSLDRAN